MAGNLAVSVLAVLITACAALWAISAVGAVAMWVMKAIRHIGGKH